MPGRYTGEEPAMSARERKIDLINAYKKMLESRKLPTIKEGKRPEKKDPADPATWSVEEQIHGEFTLWAEGQLAHLLGEQTVQTEGFTPEERKLLKAFAAKLQQKMIAPIAEPPASNPQSVQQTQGTQLKKVPMKQPEADPDPTKPIGTRLKRKLSDPLADLDELDRQAPTY